MQISGAQASGDRPRNVPPSSVRIQENPGQALGDRSHKVPDWLKLFDEGLSDQPPDLHHVVVEQPVVEPKEKTPDDMRVSSEEESTSLPLVEETKFKHGRHAQCFYRFSQRSAL